MYGIVGYIYGAVLSFVLAGIVECIFECFNSTRKEVVVRAADEIEMRIWMKRRR
jgi:hypothetical protein